MRIVMFFSVAAAAWCNYAAAACETPSVVPIPDGATATRAELAETRVRVQAYLAAMQEYLACVNQELTAEGDDAPQQFKALMVARNNAAVTEMEAVAASFNEQVRAYRAAHPEEDAARPTTNLIAPPNP